MPVERGGNVASLRPEELIKRLRWLIQLRWLFGVGVLALGAILSYFPLGEIDCFRLAGIGLAILVYNWGFWVLDRWLVRRHPKLHAGQASKVALAQIVLDLVALTLVLHLAGGIESPLYLCYVFHMVIATLLLRVGSVFALAAVAIGLFGGLTIAEMNEWVPHSPLFAGTSRYRDPQFVSMALAVFAGALLIAVYLGTSIARRLRSREREVLWLKGELAENVEELEKKNAALHEADKANTQYFRQVSHELKAPLAAQQSLLRALTIELKDIGPESRARIDRAIARGEELLALLNDLLVLSKARVVSRRYQSEWIDPAASLTDMLEAQRTRAKEANLEWRVEIQTSLPSVRIDARLLRTLAENLIANAIKYTPAGGSVAVSLTSKDRELVMQVRDTGIGISADDLARIGQEFFRTRQAQELGSPGTGLGMTIVRSIVESMKGQLDIQSELGVGTAVTIMLPIDTPESPAAGESGETTTASS